MADTTITIATSIKLSAFEVQSNLNRVRGAELLILQLPAIHEGRNTWLLNYGIGDEAQTLRAKHNLRFVEETQCAETSGAKLSIHEWNQWAEGRAKGDGVINLDIPRRSKLYCMCIAERRIYDAVQEVEKMDADVRLTQAVCLLQEAREKVADYVDGIPAPTVIENARAAGDSDAQGLKQEIKKLETGRANIIREMERLLKELQRQ